MKNIKKGQCPNCNSLIDFNDIETLAVITCPNCEAELIIPWSFGNYLLTEKENRDHKFFDFYTGYHEKSNEKVRAIMLKKDVPDYDIWLDYCRNEITSLKTLEHQNIVSIIDFGLYMSRFYVIEPCLEGFSINAYDPNEVGELEVQSVINFSKKVALALDTMHHKEFVHHNICPENIFVDNGGEVKIINLFISRFDYYYDKKVNRTHFDVSPYYISPEKAEKYREEKKGDVFSFGVFVYYFLTGKYPFDGNSVEEVINKRIKRKRGKDQIVDMIDYVEPEPITIFRGGEIKEKVDELILKLLKPYPIQRISAGEYIAELKLIDVEEIKEQSAQKRKNLLDLAETASIPMMNKLSQQQ